MQFHLRESTSINPLKQNTNNETHTLPQKMASPLATAILLAALFGVVSITKSAVPHECAAARNQNHQALRRDRVTVLMNGFSESRIPLLHSLAVAYSLSPIVSSVLVLWGNPSTASSVLHQLARNLSLSTSSSPISLLLQPSASLNNRFLPRPDHISTDAVLICDDDVEVDSKSLEFAFRVWEKNPNRLVGLFARSHDIDLNRREWVYTVHPDRFSIVLTKFMLLRARYLFLYTCVGGAGMARARGIVDAVRNCEDVLMNLVVAEEAQVGPLLVGAKRVRDYGDARNDGEEEVRVGLSSRKGEHRKRRGWCIGEFHRVLGRMPLRYSYGKVVDDVGEQGLCYKGGKIVFCDQS
ncbi:glycosyltransferase family protein 64 C3 [Vigna angularis]|uniref:glycosyltransferase family protein 64 C3 n=1 Tax=Phaseolus angularis TaxID=3914 RepID=UPI00080A6BD8|nr:glycosyltransferase family protein 64 C3 [Vigna angularis]